MNYKDVINLGSRTLKSNNIKSYNLDSELLLAKAQDENGRNLFNAGEIDVLKNEVKDSDLQSLMLAVINLEEEIPDPKN